MPRPMPPPKVEQFAMLVRASFHVFLLVLVTTKLAGGATFGSLAWDYGVDHTDGGFTKMSLRVTDRSLRSRIKSTKCP